MCAYTGHLAERLTFVCVHVADSTEGTTQYVSFVNNQGYSNDADDTSALTLPSVSAISAR